MPFEISPKFVTINRWVAKHPREAQALADLAAYVRTIPDALWDYTNIRANSLNHPCGTIGCALGHAPFVPSCAELGIHVEGGAVCGADVYDEPEEAFSLPGRVALQIFYGGNGVTERTNYGVVLERVTQVMVADRIDRWLLTGRIHAPKATP